MEKASRYYEPLPRNLRHLMEERKLSQQAVADALGVKRQSVAQYCDGSAFPSLQRLCSLADLFGVTTDYLLGRTECETTDIDIQAACARFGLSEAALARLETTNDNSVVDGFCVSNTYFNKLIDFLISNMSWMDVEEWYEALVAIQSHKRTNKISLFTSEKERILDDNSMVISLEDAKALYAQLIAHHVLNILMDEKDPYCVLSRLEKSIDKHKKY